MQRPIVVLTCCWIIGCIVGAQFPLPWMGYAAAGTAAGTAALIYLFNVPGRGILCCALAVLAAAGYYHGYDLRNVSELTRIAPGTESLSGSKVTVSGTIASPVAVDGDHVSFTVKVSDLTFEGENVLHVSEKIQVSLRLLEQKDQNTAAAWRRTDRITLRGTLQAPEPARNFGGFDYRRYLRFRHIHWLIAVKGIGQAEAVPSPFGASPGTLLLWNDRLRSALAERMDAIFPPDQAALMKSMLIGWQDDVDPQQYRQFSQLGLTHILAISGMNVAVFLGILFWVLKRIGLTRETSLVIGIVSMPFYMLLTGASPSILRAGIMAMLALYAARRGLLKDGLHLTAIAAWILLICEPYNLYDVGFQLSFLVTAGLIVGVPRVSRLLPVRSKLLNGTMSVTLVSQLVSFPVTVYYFNGFSLISWFANALLVPVFSLILFPAGLIALGSGLIYVPLGSVVGWLAGKFSACTLAVIHRFSEWKMFQLIWPKPSLFWILLYFTSIAWIYWSASRWRKHADEQALNRRGAKWQLLLAFTSFLSLLYYGYTPDRWDPNGWVEFIDVGQGDAALIRTPKGKHLLVDGGGTLTFRKPGEEWKERHDPFEVGRKTVVPLLKQRGVHQLDAVILSHEDQDHSGGLQAVVEEIPIKQFLFNGTLKPDTKVKTLFQTLLDQNIPIIGVHDNQEFKADAETALRFLYPFADHKEASDIRIAKQQNNYSLVFLLTMKGHTWLFTGDMEKDAEADILQSRNKPDYHPPVDVLKVAHHGSKTSTTEAWLDFWKPKVAVISVGARNVYGHPSPQVVSRLEEHKTELYRTDIQGAVRMEIGKDGISIRSKLDRF